MAGGWTRHFVLSFTHINLYYLRSLNHLWRMHSAVPHDDDRFDLCDEIRDARFGNRKLNARAAKVLAQMNQDPQKTSINSTFAGWADTQAAYRFLSNEKTSSEILIEAHRLQILKRCEQQDRLLLVQDTTELDYSDNSTLRGAGVIADNRKCGRTGFFLHAHYLLNTDHVPLGIWGLDFESRDPGQVGQYKARKKLPIEEKTSFRWLFGYRLACDIQSKLPGKQVVSLADREGDIFEIYAEHAERLGRGERPADFVIRAKENRALLDNETHEEIEGHLFDQDRHHEALGTITFDVPTREKILREKGKNTRYERQARRVTQEVRAYQVTFRPPFRRGKKLPVLKLWIITAKEVSPPAGEPPIEWRIVTSIPARTLAQAHGIIRDYCGRWQIEVFFRTLKTGCRIEQLRLKTASAIQVCTALYGIIAWRLNFLVEHARLHGEEPCDRYFSDEEWESTLVIAKKAKHPVRPPSLGEFMGVVAGLGGYLGRKSDPPPGVQAIWQGLQKVYGYAEAWHAFKKPNLPAS